VAGASWTGNGLIETQSGRILFTMAGVDYICSGSVIDDSAVNNGYSTVLSAGHCAYDSADGWATKWMYIPDFDDAPTYTCANSAFGCWTATRLAVHSRFVSAGGFNDQAAAVDFSFARVGLGGKGLVGTDELDARTARLWPEDERRQPDRHAVGVRLPGRGKYHGSDLVYCEGTLRNDPYGRRHMGMACNMTGRLVRAGPWIADFDQPGNDRGHGRVAQFLRLLRAHGHVRAQVHERHGRRPGVGDQRHDDERHGGAQPAVVAKHLDAPCVHHPIAGSDEAQARRGRRGCREQPARPLTARSRPHSSRITPSCTASSAAPLVTKAPRRICSRRPFCG
jgi:hypothetical protein